MIFSIQNMKCCRIAHYRWKNIAHYQSKIWNVVVSPIIVGRISPIIVGRIYWSIMIFSIQNMKCCRIAHYTELHFQKKKKCCRWIVCSYVIWRQNSVFYVRGIKWLDSLDVVVKTKELDALKLVSFCVFSFWYLLCGQLNDSSKSHIDFLVKVTLMNVLMLSHYKFWHKVFWKI